MSVFFFALRDFWGRWAVDRAGVEHGSFKLAELRDMVRNGELTPRSWLRHIWTRKYSLVGEVLFYHGLIDEDEFNAWVPKPHM